MNLDGVATLAQALLYEGYLLYPYRASSLKNRHRWTFGTLYPRAFAERQAENDPWWMQAECLVRGGDDAELQARVRFLHLVEPPRERQADTPARRLGCLRDAPEVIDFGVEAGATARGGTLAVAAAPVGDGVVKITVRVDNRTLVTIRAADPPATRRDAALPAAFASAHVILGVQGGEFVSLIDPPAPLRAAAAGCRNVGVWPVLVGRPGARGTMLAAPIILDDYPRVAPESPGDFFDATEIDELLTLRVLTLSDAEKAALRAGDPRGHGLLERTEAMAETGRRRLHGVERTLRPGARVRIAPRPGGDVLDLALAGKVATVVKLEEDLEGRRFVAVTVDEDPGRDLGADGWPGHRFFFRPDELELLP